MGSRVKIMRKGYLSQGVLTLNRVISKAQLVAFQRGKTSLVPAHIKDEPSRSSGAGTPIRCKIVGMRSTISTTPFEGLCPSM